MCQKTATIWKIVTSQALFQLCFVFLFNFYHSKIIFVDKLINISIINCKQDIYKF